jgi:hypothetical protein
MREAVTSYIVTKKKMPDGRIYESPRIYLPTKLATDSSFPFGKGTMLHVKLKGRGLVVEPAPNSILRRFGKLTAKRGKASRRRRSRRKS